ncbi:hypothetical protein K2173_026436 [Erythroxylum novogranatense]|uniref:C3H1-type domain-containing protein n=1 Tax=Erythroxylum novogranatense TaxID=1862640 RepID=A0AAV8TYX7_9ROSI|nr:hypothetical protein K2173_026436 [Erythroxylum novogranatense]
MEHTELPNSFPNPKGSPEVGPKSDPFPTDTNRDEVHGQLHKNFGLKEEEKEHSRGVSHDQGVFKENSLHQELEQKLNFGAAKNGEEEKHWNGLSEEELESGGVDINKHDNRDLNDESEKNWCGVENINNGTGSHQYPLRPDAEDCAFYMKTGSCKFGFNCKFNHPIRRKITPAKEKLTEGEEATERPGQTECKYYLRTGGCKYGSACKYNHSGIKPPVLPVSELNFLGLPVRPGKKECPYYMRNGSCKYGPTCKFNHPDPMAAGGSEPSSAFGNGGSAPLHVSLQSSVASWSSSRALNETASFVPVMFSPTYGVPTPNSEWNKYQAPVYPPERSIHLSPAYVINNSATDTNVYGLQQQLQVGEFPERPGEPECNFYMKTGDCKFKSNCKFHHPKNRISTSTPCALSDKGLPLRPDQGICSYYGRYGICKYGPACKFDHPVHLPSSTALADDDQHTSVGQSATEEASIA